MELKSGDLFIFDWRRKNGEDASAKRNKCWTIHSWVEIIIRIDITLV